MLSLKHLLRTAALVLFLTMLAGAALAQSSRVKVMTYNVDEGTDFTAITAVLTNNGTAAQFQAAVAATAAEVQASNPVVRAQYIANAITANQPDVVGLQEAASWTFGTTQIDMLQLILQALADRGQSYAAVVTVPEFQLDLTATLGVAFADRDVILARTDEPDLQITGTQQGHYSVLIPLPAFPPYLPASSITRGWGYIDGQWQGNAFRFLTTHLEDGTNTASPYFALVQAAQAIELVYGPAKTSSRLLLGGDFNVEANDPRSPTYLTYLFMVANGFQDAWRIAHPFLPGYTCCQEDLQDATSELNQRIDLVFVRNRVGVAGAQLVGNGLDDSIPLFPSWPSDHAGVLVSGKLR